MREYETVFLLHPSLDDKEVEAEIQAVCDLVTRTGGKVEDIERWGRRRLAYDIQKVHDGTYTLVRFRAEAQTLNDLNRRYRLNERLLRHITVRSEGPPPPPLRAEGEGEERSARNQDEGEFELPRTRPDSYAAPPAPPAAGVAPSESAGTVRPEA